MNTALWVVQGWLAVLFFSVGVMKLVTPKAELERRKGMGYAADRSVAEMKWIGLAEVLGALGLVLPWLLGIVPVLTPLAALGLAATMGGAIMIHYRRNEPVAVPAVLLTLLLFVVVGRLAFMD